MSYPMRFFYDLDHIKSLIICIYSRVLMVVFIQYLFTENDTHIAIRSYIHTYESQSITSSLHKVKTPNKHRERKTPPFDTLYERASPSICSNVPRMTRNCISLIIGSITIVLHMLPNLMFLFLLY
jgi:hypothetical protein